MSGTVTSGNRTHAKRAPGAGRPKGSVKPPRIDSHGNLIFNVWNLSQRDIELLLRTLGPFWKPKQDDKEQTEHT